MFARLLIAVQCVTVRKLQCKRPLTPECINSGLFVHGITQQWKLMTTVDIIPMVMVEMLSF